MVNSLRNLSIQSWKNKITQLKKTKRNKKDLYLNLRSNQKDLTLNITFQNKRKLKITQKTKTKSNK